MKKISPYKHYKAGPPFEHLKSVLPFEHFTEMEWKEFILAFQNEKEHSDKPNILQYLVCSDDTSYGVTFGWACDPLTGESIGSTSQYTDSVWAWQKTVPYFIEKYNIPLPEEFIEHMRNNNWVCPKQPPIELTEEERALAEKSPIEVLPGGFVAIRRSDCSRCACPRPLSDAKNVGSEPENGKN